MRFDIAILYKQILTIYYLFIHHVPQTHLIVDTNQKAIYAITTVSTPHLQSLPTRTTIFFFTAQNQSRPAMKKKYKKPIRQPSKPTQNQRPKTTNQGTRSSPLSIQSSTVSRLDRLPCGKCESKNGFTLGFRGSTHRLGWSLWLL